MEDPAYTEDFPLDWPDAPFRPHPPIRTPVHRSRPFALSLSKGGPVHGSRLSKGRKPSATSG
jgi:hypothetical protein